MRFSSKVGCFVLFMSANVSLAKDAKQGHEMKLETDMQKASYAIGRQIGESMKSQGVEVDVAILADSMKEALAGTKSRMTEEESHKSMQTLQAKVREKAAQDAKKNIEEGDKYLAENAKKKGVKTTSSGLQYEVVKEGKGAVPSETSRVKVHYQGTLLNNKEFDSSYKRNEPAEFGVNEVIPGWTEALKLMKVGSVYNLTIPSKLAYGEHGQGGIPPNSVLKFKVELLDIVKAKDPEKVKEAEKVNDKAKTTIK